MDVIYIKSLIDDKPIIDMLDHLIYQMEYIFQTKGVPYIRATKEFRRNYLNDDDNDSDIVNKLCHSSNQKVLGLIYCADIRHNIWEFDEDLLPSRDACPDPDPNTIQDLANITWCANFLTIFIRLRHTPKNPEDKSYGRNYTLTFVPELRQALRLIHLRLYRLYKQIQIIQNDTCIRKVRETFITQIPMVFPSIVDNILLGEKSGKNGND